MGGCNSCIDPPQLREIIEKDSKNEVLSLGYSHDMQRKLTEDLFSFDKDLKVNSISYALLKGKINAVVGLEELGLTGKNIYQCLIQKKFDPLRYFVSGNHTKGLKYYLELYLDPETHLQSLRQGEETYIQTCVRLGMHGNLETIYNYFRNKKTYPTPELSFDSKGAFGENCVLYACRYGQHVLLEYFWEKLNLKIQFSDQNDENLGAIELCLLGYNHFHRETYNKCLEFLVNEARVCPRFSKDSLKKLVETEAIILVLESLLNKCGIGFPECFLSSSFEKSQKWVEYPGGGENFRNTSISFIPSDLSSYSLV